MATSAPVEKKVTAATLGSYFASLAGLAIVNAVQDDASLIESFPDWLETILLPLLPTAVTFISGFSAKHTHRPDLRARDAGTGTTTPGATTYDGGL